jgi:hypothetical protein
LPITPLTVGSCTPGALARLAARLKPLASDRMPLDVPPPRTSRFGSPLVLSRVHWAGPELVAEVTYLEWTDDGLRRQVRLSRTPGGQAGARGAARSTAAAVTASHCAFSHKKADV